MSVSVGLRKHEKTQHAVFTDGEDKLMHKKTSGTIIGETAIGEPVIGESEIGESGIGESGIGELEIGKSGNRRIGNS